MNKLKKATLLAVILSAGLVAGCGVNFSASTRVVDEEEKVDLPAKTTKIGKGPSNVYLIEYDGKKYIYVYNVGLIEHKSN